MVQIQIVRNEPPHLLTRVSRARKRSSQIAADFVSSLRFNSEERPLNRSKLSSVFMRSTANSTFTRHSWRGLRRRQDARVSPALSDFQTTQDSAADIAARYGIQVSTLRKWTDRAGFPRRPRGRKPRREPTPEQKSLLSRVGSMPLSKLAKEVGRTKQFVHILAKRWPDWVGQRSARRIQNSGDRNQCPPFELGGKPDRRRARQGFNTGRRFRD